MLPITAVRFRDPVPTEAAPASANRPLMRETTLMKLRLNKLAVSFVALSVLSVPASAGDWNNGDGSLKESRGRAAVAVPAPMPIPESNGLGWYMRGDVGIGRGNSNEISESGSRYGVANGVDALGNTIAMSSPLSAFGSSPSWFSNDGRTTLNYGAGVGYHWSKNFRTDVTLDRRNTDFYSGRGHYQYSYNSTTPAPGSVVTTTTVRGSVNDDTQVKSGTLLLNGYYDVGNYRGFTPYIGAGMGFALLNIHRQSSVSEQSACSTVPACTATPLVFGAPVTNGADVVKNEFAFAAMMTTGVSYSLTQNTAIDVNYRFLFINGQATSLAVPGGYGNSKMTLGDIGEHQLRAGLRWDIN
jgi:opacity protein-like surface antigen